MPAWVIVVGALLLPFVMVAFALGFGRGIEWSQRHTKTPGVLSILLGLLYVLAPLVEIPSFPRQNVRIWTIVTGSAWILLGCGQLFDAHRHRLDASSNLSDSISEKDEPREE